jgi:NH3-dependent NAD+ synthetase
VEFSILFKEMDIMATEENIVDDTLLDEEIDQLANEIAAELEAELEEAYESPSKPGDGGTGSAPESGEVKAVVQPKGNKLSKKKVKAEVKTKGQGDDPSEIEVYEEQEAEETEEDLDIPVTKQEMLRSIFETLKTLDKDSLAGNYEKLMAAMLDEGTTEDDDEDLVAPVIERTPFTTEDIDITEDLNAIFGENDLSEEFKTQVATIFEAAVVSKINTEIELIEQEFSAKLEASVEEIAGSLTEQIDSYLDYAVDQWMSDNELAVERGIKTEVTEEFIGGLKQLFMEHYVDIPEERVDVVDSLADRVEELENSLNESIEANIELNSIVESFQRDELVDAATADLTNMEAEKLRSLSEGVDFEDVDQYQEALETLRESYFPRASKGGAIDLNEEAEISEEGIFEQAPTDPVMASVINVLGRTVKQ